MNIVVGWYDAASLVFMEYDDPDGNFYRVTQ